MKGRFNCAATYVAVAVSFLAYLAYGKGYNSGSTTFSEEEWKVLNRHDAVRKAPIGQIAYLDEEGKTITREDVLSFYGSWGRNLQRVKAVVVTIPSNDDEKRKSPDGVEGLKAAFEIDSYKKMLLAQPGCHDMTHPWSEEDGIELYVVEKHNYGGDSTWKADLGKILGSKLMTQLPTDKPIIFEDAFGTDWSGIKRQISARDINRVINELGNDEEFGKNLKAAREAGTDSSQLVYDDAFYGKKKEKEEKIPSLFPELDHLNLQNGNTVKRSTESKQLNIDTSRLESLTRKRSSLIKTLVAKGEKATSRECAEVNAVSQECRDELARIVLKLDAAGLSLEEMRQICKGLETRLKPLTDEMERLTNEALAKGIIGSVTEMPLTDVQRE